jgi:hypothetical protein
LGAIGREVIAARAEDMTAEAIFVVWKGSVRRVAT